jgi:hypothetical protein
VYTRPWVPSAAQPKRERQREKVAGYGRAHLVIPGLRKLRQEDLKFEASLGYVVKLSQKKKKRRNVEPEEQGEAQQHSTLPGMPPGQFIVDMKLSAP